MVRQHSLFGKRLCASKREEILIVAIVSTVSTIQQNCKMIRMMGGRRRAHVELILEILKSTEQRKSKTRLMQEIGMSSSQLNHYLRFLVKRGMIVDDEKKYMTTPKGLVFIRRFQEIILLLA